MTPPGSVVPSPAVVRAPGLGNAPRMAPLVAASFGALLGVVTFFVTAWLWRHGATGAASVMADAALLLALACIAAFAVLDGPTRMHKARVPIGRVLPPEWWPQDSETVPLLAACVGAPLVVVQRKSDGQKGSLFFQHQLRFYFGWQADE